MDIITELGMVVRNDINAEGYYTVSVWVRTETAMVRMTDMYHKLSWTEACDVMLVMFDANRPGAGYGDIAQDSLW